MVKAVHDVVSGEDALVVVEHSLEKNIYCEIRSSVAWQLQEDLLSRFWSKK